MKKSLIRFLVSGAANTLVTYAGYLLLLRMMPYVWAYTIAYVAGILMAYVMQTRYVFEVRTTWRTFLRFPLIYLLQYAVGALGIRVLVEGGLLSKETALLATLVITVPLGFFLSRYLLAHRKE
ncbi:MAG: polysaccharide synthesis protein GtrA [Bryobacterales bacterium]|nr:polysaccharide synthesis protein GtrA [Bryobacterales bacterium]